MINSFHLLPMRDTVVATGHSGSSSFVFIVYLVPFLFILCRGVLFLYDRLSKSDIGYIGT